MDPEAVLRPHQQQALDAWRALVLANREQIERLREDQREGDFWARRSGQFRPGIRPSPEVDYIASIARPEDALLDIGAGGGRFAVPLSRRLREIIAVDPSPSMRETLAAAASEEGATNVRIIAGRWPEAAEETPEADLSLAAHVLYDIDDIGGFIQAMERRTRRLCTAIIGDRAPSTAFEPAWSELQGEPLHRLPALRELLAVLGALGRRVDVRTFPLGEGEPLPPEEAHAAARRLYWVAEGSEKDGRLRELLVRHYGRRDGLVAIPPRLNFTAAVSWSPRHD